MPSQVWLAVGDTGNPPTDYLDLLDGVNYILKAQTWDADATHMTRRQLAEMAEVPALVDPLTASGTRRVHLELSVYGATSDQLLANIRALTRKIQQARTANGPGGVGPTVCLWYRYGQGSGWVYWDVVDGLAIPVNDLGTDGLSHTVQLDLFCLPYAHGDAITYLTTATITNGQPGTLYLPNVPGDVDAPAQVLLTDVSVSGAVINRVRFARRALYGMLAGDFVPWLDAAPSGFGASVTDATCLGGAKARLTGAAGDDWKTVATVTPTGAATRGLFDVWARVANTGAVGTPIGVGVFLQPSGGNLLAGTYSYAVTSVDAGGNESAASPVVVTSVPANLPLWSEDFESGMANWTATATGSGSVLDTFGFPTAHSGQYVAAFFTSNSTGDRATAWRAIPTVSGTQLQVSCWLNLGGTTEPASAMDLLYLADGSGTVLFALSRTTTGYEARLRQSSGSYLTQAVTVAATGWLPVLFQYNWSGAATGSLWVSGVPVVLTDTGGATASQPARFYANALGTATGGFTFSLDDVVVGAPVVGNQTQHSNHLGWTPGVGAVNHYVYWQSTNSAGWVRIATGSSAGGYTHVGTEGVAAIAPPLNTPTGVNIRAAADVPGIASQMGSPSLLAQTDPALARSWQMVYLGTFPLPPVATPEGRGSPPWELVIQAKAQAASYAATLDIDCVLLAPHGEPQLVAEYAGLGLIVLSSWRIDTRRDGYAGYLLEASGGGVAVGGGSCQGYLTVGPGDTLLVVNVDGTGGASDVTNLQYTLQVRVVPRYAYLRGMP